MLMYVHYSENLSVPVKFESQSLHWFHVQISLGNTESTCRENITPLRF